MKIGLVIHGPEVIDSGEIITVLEKLSLLGVVETKLSGTMGKTAVLDAGLENIIDISEHLKPSARIEAFFETHDLVCLLNRGKTIETGRAFGQMVAARLTDPEKKPLVQIESPGSTEGRLIPLNKKASRCLPRLSEIFGLPAEIFLPFQSQLKIEKSPDSSKTRVIRKLSGVFPGENILINGIVVGKALNSDITIVSENGFIAEIQGGEIKEHGMEKLHNYEKKEPLDLTKAWVKSGTIRRELSSSGLSPDASARITPARCTGLFSSSPGKVVLIDHAAEYTFELAAEAELVITVGDDTTAIAGDILYRLGIPIIGIIDGDCDDLVCTTVASPGSTVITVTSGNDDLIGKELKQKFFGEENSVFMEDICGFKEKVLKIAQPMIESVFEY
jgi:hypothetical protein